MGFLTPPLSPLDLSRSSLFQSLIGIGGFFNLYLDIYGEPFVAFQSLIGIGGFFNGS